MVKLFSFIVFTSALISSWYLFNSKSSVNVGVHAGLQSKLATIIEKSIQEARPNAYDFQMISLYTKSLEENKINAYFSYRYSEKLDGKEISEQKIKGEAMLNRTLSENKDDQKWIVQTVMTNSTAIEFKEGSIITPEAEDALAPITATPAKPDEPKKTK